MSQKKRHVLNVYSQEISLLSSDSEEYMSNLANFVDERMRNYAEGVSRISFGDLCILTSLSIADEFFKSKESVVNLEADKVKLESDLSDALSTIMSLEAKARERDVKIEELEEKLQNMDSSLSTKTEDKEALVKKLNVLSYELQKPLEARNYQDDLKAVYSLAGIKKEDI